MSEKKRVLESSDSAGGKPLRARENEGDSTGTEKKQNKR